MPKSIPTNGITKDLPLLRRVSTFVLFSCLSCTAIIADAPYAVAQGYYPAQQQNGYQQGSTSTNFVPGLVDQPEPYAPPSQAGYQRGTARYQAPFQQQQGATEVPAGTELEVKLEKSLNSGKDQVGDTITAKLLTPLYAEGTAVIPADSILTGSVTKVTSAKASNGAPGSLELKFTSLQTPDGRTFAMSASINDTATPSGRASGYRNGYGPMYGNLARMSYYAMGYGGGMGYYGMGYGGAYGGMGSMAYMAPMIGMMGLRMIGSLASIRGSGSSEAKLSKGAQLQLKLDRPVMVSESIQPAASNQQQPQYGAYSPAGYAPGQQVPAGYAQRL